MTASNFDRSLALVFVSEGGYVNNPNDPGGATNLGITSRTLAAYRGKHVSVDDVRALTKAEASQIYRKYYWDIIHGNDLPPGIDYAVFDFAVNSGPTTAVKFLQRALSIPDDGVIGPLTLKAISQVRPSDLVKSLCDKRLAYLRSLGTWVDFGAGWSARIARVRADTLRMAAPLSAVQTPVPANPPAPDDPGPAATPPTPPVQPKGPSMSPNFLKGLFGTIMGFAGVLMPMVPPQYQPILAAIIGLFGGGHGLISAATNKS
jgi:lysozyme family protein